MGLIKTSPPVGYLEFCGGRTLVPQMSTGTIFPAIPLLWSGFMNGMNLLYNVLNLGEEKHDESGREDHR